MGYLDTNPAACHRPLIPRYEILYYRVIYRA